ncbi:MAG: hypothetical protein ACFFAO_17525, partial [Candidatus Hermodarchaeota archaeon]
MMNYSILDAKLKTLIRVCKETENYKKLAVVSFMLTSNLLNDIAIKLGIRPRKQEYDETLASYMILINSVLKDNFKIELFKEETIDKIKSIEYQFLKRKGDIPLKFIVEMYDLYYEIRKFEIPNLYNQWNENYFLKENNSSLYSNLYFLEKGKNSNKEDKMKSLILQNLKQKETTLQNKLNQSYDKESFENAIYLKKIKDTLKNQNEGKIEFKGRLKDNLKYQKSMENIIGYFLIGFFILFFIIGFIIV